MRARAVAAFGVSVMGIHGNLRDSAGPPIEWLLQSPRFEDHAFEGECHFEDIIPWFANTRQWNIRGNGFRV